MVASGSPVGRQWSPVARTGTPPLKPPKSCKSSTGAQRGRRASPLMIPRVMSTPWVPWGSVGPDSTPCEASTVAPGGQTYSAAPVPQSSNRLRKTISIAETVGYAAARRRLQRL
eukprot:734044-Prymnesium_polylepis.3